MGSGNIEIPLHPYSNCSFPAGWETSCKDRTDFTCLHFSKVFPFYTPVSRFSASLCCLQPQNLSAHMSECCDTITVDAPEIPRAALQLHLPWPTDSCTMCSLLHTCIQRTTAPPQISRMVLQKHWAWCLWTKPAWELCGCREGQPWLEILGSVSCQENTWAQSWGWTCLGHDLCYCDCHSC